jgi:hypothetical protein
MIGCVARCWWLLAPPPPPPLPPPQPLAGLLAAAGADVPASHACRGLLLALVHHRGSSGRGERERAQQLAWAAVSLESGEGYLSRLREVVRADINSGGFLLHGHRASCLLLMMMMMSCAEEEPGRHPKTLCEQVLCATAELPPLRLWLRRRQGCWLGLGKTAAESVGHGQPGQPGGAAVRRRAADVAMVMLVHGAQLLDLVRL